SVVAFANPVMLGVRNILAPRSVLAWKTEGGAGLKRQAIRDALLLGAIMTSFCLLVLFAGEDVLRFLYHGTEYEGHGHVLTVLALAMLASAVGMPASNALASMERPRAIVLVGTVAAALTVALVFWWMTQWGLLGAAYGFLAGNLSLRLPGRLASTRFGRGARRAVEEISASLRPLHRKQVRRWREGVVTALDEFLSFILGREPDRSGLVKSSRNMAALLQLPLPPDLSNERVAAPSPFPRLDPTQGDVLGLGRCLVEKFPDRSQGILLVGLRTSGSYFAPLLRAFLRSEGYKSLALLTLEPSKGAGRWESRELRHDAARGYVAAIVDDPPHTAATILAAFDIVGRAGFARSKLAALVPAHTTRRDC